MNRIAMIILASFVLALFNPNLAAAQTSVAEAVCPPGHDQVECLKKALDTLSKAREADAASQAQQQRLLDQAKADADAARKEAAAAKADASKPTPAQAVASSDERSSRSQLLAIDPRVLDHTGYVGGRPAYPNALASDLRWGEAGNCFTIINSKKNPADGGVLLRVSGVTKVVDRNGVIVSGEVYLAPSDDYSFCGAGGDLEPRVTITNTTEVSSGGEVVWNHLLRKMTSVVRGSSRDIKGPFGRDRRFYIY